MRFGVRERVSAEGKILLAPDEHELVELCDAIRASGAESVAISLLLSFANPENERRVAAALMHAGKAGGDASLYMADLPISISHEILPEFREYERAATVVVNAYLAPKAGAYMQRLESAIRDRTTYCQVAPHVHIRRMKTRTRSYVMQSSGGIVSARARR